MASLKLSHIYKVYDNGHKAVNDFSIDIKDKEFIVFVGPSGCGKSTTLRMIAGLEEITAGDLFIGDTLVNDMEPKDRDIAMVFQNYALYPHMSVYENMAFGLRNRHISKEEIDKKVKEAAKILDITDYLDRKPKAMSGGQRQRVALGRAIVRDPKVFLLDEPLSNLDAKLRAQMRTEITKLHKKLQTTFIYVTHDQVEAMTMGTRIVVMKLGYVQQIDTPMNLYNKPYNKFVAGFIGTPQMNFFDVTLLRKGNNVDINFPTKEILTVPFDSVSKINNSYLTGKKKVVFGIRPEHLTISKGNTGISCIVSAIEHLGNETIIYGDIGDKKVEFSMANTGRKVVIKVTDDIQLEIGQKIMLDVDFERAHYFDGECEEGVTLIQDIPSHSDVTSAAASGVVTLFGKNVKLPDAISSELKDAKEITFEIPPCAITKGNDFALTVTKVEKVGDCNLAYLDNNGQVIFALVDKNVKEKSKYNFAVAYDLIKVIGGKKEVKPLNPNVNFVGKFVKHETKEERERVLNFAASINNVEFEIKQKDGFKMNVVEGNKCYSRYYRYEIPRDKVSISDFGIHGIITKVLDYGYEKYFVVSISDNEEVVVNLVKNFNVGDEIQLTFDGKEASIYSVDIDMKII